MDLGKHIRQVAEQAKDKVLRLQRACERTINSARETNLVLLYQISEGLLLPQLQT